MSLPLLPPRLRRGDLIGIVAPSGPVTDSSRIERGVRYLERLGYPVVVGTNVPRVHGYLAGTDGERLSDLHAMFRDRRVKAIIALRGGYGSTRLLSRLQYRLIARNPKILVGFSDLTALQLALWTRCRMITLHGPMLSSDFAGHTDPFTEELFWRLVTSPAVPERLPLPRGPRPLLLASGRASGRLLGGNLSLIVSLLGTPYLPTFSGSLLFFEEVGEEPYRIDRMVTQLRNAGVLGKVRGILTGQFHGCVPADRTRPSLTTGEVLSDLAEGAGMPFLANLPFGHVGRKWTLPIGVKACLDPEKRTLDLLEPAVR